MRNGKKTLLRGSFLLAVGAILASVSAALGWFSNHAEVDSRTTGSAVGSYFAYGSGTADDPFGLTLPRHVYNLAWLQDLGYFNQTDSSGKIQQYYFELASDIDMSTLSTAIPPVGTEEKPFVGHFTSRPKDGKSYMVSNLQVSNDFSSYSVHPSSVSGFGRTLAQPHIVGFFGVVGEIGVSAPSDYSSSVLSLSGFNLAGAKVTSVVSDTLVGIAAGYVNGTLEDVGITSSSASKSTLNLNGSVNSYTTTSSKTFPHVSDYTLVGYAEEAYKDTVYRSVTNISNPYVEDLTYVAGSDGDSSGWGGSINMKSMYDHIRPLYEGSTIYSYATEKNVTVTVDSTGKVSVSKADAKTRQAPSWRSSTSSSVTYRDSYSVETSNGAQTASFSFAQRYDDGSVNSRYLYLSGKKTVSPSGPGSVTWHSSLPSIQNVAPQTISDGYGNYLACSSKAVANSTSASRGDTLWYLSGSQVFTLDPSDNFSVLYLTDSNGRLTLSSSSTTSWTITSSRLKSSSGRYLVYLNGTWTLTDEETVSIPGYVISGSYGYLSADTDTRSVSLTSEEEATPFYVDANGYYYASFNGSPYYLAVTSSSYSRYGDITMVNSTSAPSNGLKKDGRYLVGTDNGSTYYLGFSWYSSSPEMYSSRSSATSLTFTASGSLSVPVNRTLTLARQSTYDVSGLESYSYTTKDTYFPLQYDTANTTAPSAKNTGYVIAGANENSYQKSDIRVSYYPISDDDESNLKASNFTSTSDTLSGTNVYTINESKKNHKLTSSEIASFSKFESSLSALQKVLTQNNSSSYIYGLHFMDAKISTSHLITVPSAQVNGTSYRDYEMPEDAIDFHLKDKGYVNFFAGTYFPGNNSFFSLHRIFRNESDETKIQDIKEIIGVYEYQGSDPYGKAYCYVYQYSDKTFSHPYWYRTVNGKRVKCAVGTQTPLSQAEADSTTTSVPTGYKKMVFDTAWIKAQSRSSNWTDDAVYYFEVPMNDGEFALGSVDGGTGAYLMYLDIGGNASTVDRTKVSEKVTTVVSKFDVPKGVALLAKAADAVKNLDSACVAILSGYSGKSVQVERETLSGTSQDQVLVTGADGTSCYPSYGKLGMLLKDGSGNSLSLSKSVLSTKTVYRLTLIDYSENLAEFTKSVIIKDGSSYTAKVYDEGGNELDRASHPIYDDQGRKVESVDDSSFFTAMVQNESSYFTGTNLAYTFDDSQPSSFMVDYGFTVSLMDNQTGKTFYQIASYLVTVTNNTDASKTVTLMVEEGPSSSVLLKGLDDTSAASQSWSYSFLLVHDGSQDTLSSGTTYVLNP